MARRRGRAAARDHSAKCGGGLVAFLPAARRSTARALPRPPSGGVRQTGLTRRLGWRAGTSVHARRSVRTTCGVACGCGKFVIRQERRRGAVRPGRLILVSPPSRVSLATEYLESGSARSISVCAQCGVHVRQRGSDARRSAVDRVVVDHRGGSRSALLRGARRVSGRCVLGATRCVNSGRGVLAG